MFRGDPGLPGLDKDLFQFDVGHVGLFKTGLGEYLVLIKDRRAGETLPFEQAKTAAKNLIQRTIQERAISDLVADLRKRTDIVFSPEGEEMKGEPGKGTADFS